MFGAMEINEAIVARLVAIRMPHLAVLPIAALPGGWDNRSFRVGDRWVARLPSADRYVAAIEKEHRVLPLLAGRLPLPIPRLAAAAAGGPAFARPWSIMEWIDGETAHGIVGPEQRALASDLAAFLGALHAVDPTQGPPPGAHSFGRGGPLASLDQDMRQALPRLGSRAAAAAASWQRARASTFAGAAVWLHGDLHPGNLLVRGGRLSAVIDWGLAAVGDPAADLSIAWRWFDADARRTFRTALPMDEGAWARGAGWATWKASVILAGLPGTNQSEREWAAATLEKLAADPELSQSDIPERP